VHIAFKVDSYPALRHLCSPTGKRGRDSARPRSCLPAQHLFHRSGRQRSRNLL
jgi:hypothetical protein